MGEWLAQQDWRDVLSKEGADLKEKELSKLLEAQLDKEMPLQTFRAKSDEKPWMTNGIRGMIQQKKKIYKRMGFKSQEWKKMKREVEKVLFEKKEAYYKRTVASLKGAARKNWHRRMKVLMDSEPTRKWSVRDLWPDRSDRDIAELLADHFNQISMEFTPLKDEDCLLYTSDAADE